MRSSDSLHHHYSKCLSAIQHTESPFTFLTQLNFRTTLSDTHEQPIKINPLIFYVKMVRACFHPCIYVCVHACFLDIYKHIQYIHIYDHEDNGLWMSVSRQCQLLHCLNCPRQLTFLNMCSLQNTQLVPDSLIKCKILYP